MHAFHVFIQFSGRCEHFPTEFSNFQSTSQWLHLKCSFISAEDVYSLPQNSQISIHITMCTFDMFIQFSSRYAHFPTEFTSFHSTPQSMHSFHVLTQLSGRYVRIPTEIANFHFTSQCVLLICLFNSVADQSNHSTQKRYALFPTEFTITSSPCLQFQFLIHMNKYESIKNQFTLVPLVV